MSSAYRLLSLGLVVGLAAGGCLRKVADEDLPTSGPNPAASPSAAPSLTPVTPVPVGPAPVPTPTPIGGGTPAPGDPSQPTPPPSSGGCRLPPSSGNDCSRTSPVFLGDVQVAINALIQAQPDLFIKRACEGCYDVTDANAYISGVVANLGRRGLCATYDGEELAVKNSNDFNEQYDILSAGGSVRSGGESYRSTCRPAVF